MEPSKIEDSLSYYAFRWGAVSQREMGTCGGAPCTVKFIGLSLHKPKRGAFKNLNQTTGQRGCSASRRNMKAFCRKRGKKRSSALCSGKQKSREKQTEGGRHRSPASTPFVLHSMRCGALDREQTEYDETWQERSAISHAELHRSSKPGVAEAQARGKL